jgi:hypothetical protein
MKRFVALTLILLMVFPTSAFADGAIWRYYNNRLEPLEENEQRAAINYQNGIEKLIIDVNFNIGAADRAVWIFPVPAKPEKVVIDVLTEFPVLYGRDPRAEARNSIGTLLAVSALTQIYPLFLMPFLFWTSYGFAPMASSAVKEDSGVTVYEHIEKQGITTEIITSLSGDALYNYLVGQGLTIERSAIDVFDDYIGKDYSFVVSWVTSSGGTAYQTGSSCSYQSCSYSDSQCPNYGWDYNGGGSCIEMCDYTGSQGCAGTPHGCYCSGTFGCACSGGGIAGGSAYVAPSYYTPGRQLGIYVTFPTDRIFFPLMPTSIYGSTKIPVTLYVLDHVTPQLYDSISSYVKSDYYISTYTSVSNELKSFYGNMETRNMRYTKIEILDAPAKYFTEDLWLSYGAPLNVGLATMIYGALSQQPLIAGILMVLIISAIAGALAGYILFRNWRRYALLGLANVFSIIGLAIAVLLSKSESKMSDDLKTKLKKEGFSVVDMKKFSLIPLFSALYLAVCLALYLLFSIIL